MNTLPKSKFNQLCVWEGVILEGSSPEGFEAFILEKFGSRIKFTETVVTLSDTRNGETVEGTGGRHDLFFFIHDDDIPKFSVKKLQCGIRWWEDVLDNQERRGESIYSSETLQKYKKKW